MKHCVQYPDEKFLAVRPCLVAICFGNRPAAKLLGTLLYRYNLRVENKDDAENQNAIKAAKGENPDQDITYRIFRKQAQLVDDMCDEMTEKTLHDVAVPMLQLLGYLELEEYMQSNCYIVNIEQVQEALNLYSPTGHEQVQLEKFLISHMQLEKFLITSVELEKFLIDRKIFQSGLEKVLIWNRNFSNCKRGRKSSPHVDLDDNSETPQNTKESSKKNIEEREREVAHATARPPLFYSMLQMPTTYEDALIYLTPHGLEPISGLNEIQVVKLAQKLWTEAHEDDEDTVEREAVKPSQKDVAHVQNQTHSGNPGNSSQPHLNINGHSRPLDASLTSQTEHRKDTNKITEPPAPRKPPSNPVPKRPKQQGLMDEIPGDAIPEKAIAIMDRWDRIHKKPAPRTIKTIQAAQLLMVYDPSEDELRECEKWLYTTDRPGKPWYRSHGVHLPDIAEKIGSWQSLQNAPPPTPEKPPSNEHKASSFYTLDALIERQNQWKTEGVTS